MSLRILFLIAVAATFAGASSRAADSTAEIDRIKAEAWAAHPGDPEAGAQAVSEALERWALSQGGNAKVNAARVFLGFHTKHVFELPAVCSDQGVDIAAFVGAFKRAHQAEFSAAASLVDVDASIERARPSARKNAYADLDQLARLGRTDIKGVCGFINANAQEFVDNMQFGQMMPRIREQLVGR